MNASSEASSYIKPCSRSLPADQLTECVTQQARNIQLEFSKGIPQFGMEPLDPLALDEISAKAGTFNIKSKNLFLKGLKKMEIKEVRHVGQERESLEAWCVIIRPVIFLRPTQRNATLHDIRPPEGKPANYKWNFDKNSGLMKMFGNMTFQGDYETDGRLLLIPFKGNGKITVKARDTINQVMNDNWRDLIKELGPPYNKAVANKVHEIVNKLYKNVPFDELFAP
ncbi:hypothetical protein MSG28_009673 [Choristoneura fumiferana]|uniref:Uncharacterized protein n=1 Tax=Choristoneura fumiferana TaxID=7141 RepID=A0ACC0JC14_CHOFU|nr:hypothetical protein MSG28_009673 [Choristoneura fumiferana]